MSEKITISRNLSDRKSREWWAAIDEIASHAPTLELERKPFGRSVPPVSRTKAAAPKPPRSKK